MESLQASALYAAAGFTIDRVWGKIDRKIVLYRSSDGTWFCLGFFVHGSLVLG